MNDIELVEKLRQIRSDAFESLCTALRTPHESAGYKSQAEMILAMLKSKRKVISDFITDNIQE